MATPAHVEVRPTADGVVVCVMWERVTARCDADGYNVKDAGTGRLGAMDLAVHLPATASLTVSTVSGDITITGARQQVRTSSVTGGTYLSGLRVSSLSVESVSGEIEVGIAAVTGFGALIVTSVSGPIRVELSTDLNVDVSLVTLSGRVRSDFASTTHRRSGGWRNVEARVGRGGHQLAVRTLSGLLRLQAAQ
jgi:DUF4097 and DUF4098 domain-containing protein YvlB